MQEQRKHSAGHIVGLVIALVFTSAALFATWLVWQHDHRATTGFWICVGLVVYGLYGAAIAVRAIRKDHRTTISEA